jgi:hypothetical protein
MYVSEKKTKAEALQDIANAYIAAGESWPAGKRTIAAWAVRNKMWEPQRHSLIDQCAQEIADAMRLEMEQDPQGRTVRAKLCAKITEKDASGKLVQKTLWFGRDAAPELMHRSLQQRREGVLGDCKQLKTDQDSYNENNTFGTTIQLSFDFTKDLADAEHGTEYAPPPPPDDQNDD